MSLSPRMIGAAPLSATDLLPSPGSCTALLDADLGGRAALAASLAGGGCAGFVVRRTDPLFSRLDVAGNVALPLRARLRSGGECARQSSALLALLGLERRAHDKVAGLDPETRIGVLLARAAATGTRLLILDDPFAEQEPGARGRLQNLCRRLTGLGEVGILLVTRSRTEALATGDRVGLVERDGVRALATPAALFDEPGSAAVAASLTGANLIDGCVEALDEEDERDATIRLGSGRLVAATIAPGTDQETLSRGSLCRVAVRPESIAFAAVEAAEMGSGALPATLIEHRHHGDHIRLRLKLEDGAVLLVRRPAGALGPRELARAARPLGASIAWRASQATAYPQPDG